MESVPATSSCERSGCTGENEKKSLFENSKWLLDGYLWPAKDGACQKSKPRLLRLAVWAQHQPTQRLFLLFSPPSCTRRGWDGWRGCDPSGLAVEMGTAQAGKIVQGNSSPRWCFGRNVLPILIPLAPCPCPLPSGRGGAGCSSCWTGGGGKSCPACPRSRAGSSRWRSSTGRCCDGHLQERGGHGCGRPKVANPPNHPPRFVLLRARKHQITYNQPHQAEIRPLKWNAQKAAQSGWANELWRSLSSINAEMCPKLWIFPHPKSCRSCFVADKKGAPQILSEGRASCTFHL